MMCSCHVTELGDIGFYLSGEGEGNQTDLVVQDVRIYSATGRSELDADNYVSKQRNCPRCIGLSGYGEELRHIVEPGNDVSCQLRANDLRDIGKGPPGYTAQRYLVRRSAGPLHGRHRPRVSYCIYIENSMDNIVASAVDVLFI